MQTGLYRDSEGWVRVKQLNTGLQKLIPKVQYVASGSKPAFEQLPTKTEYEALENKRT
jgi:hypothetical protein